MYNSNQDRQKQKHKKRTYFASRTSPTDLRLLPSIFFIPGPTSVLGIFLRTRRFLYFTFVFFVHVYRYKTEQLNSCTFGHVPWLDQVICNNHSWDPMFINCFCAAPLRGALCCETPSPVVCVCVCMCVCYFWRHLRMLSLTLHLHNTTNMFAKTLWFSKNVSRAKSLSALFCLT